MRVAEKYFARLKFQLLVHKCIGQEFENVFTRIMQWLEVDFRAIKPYGNIGDRKNDGFVPSKGVYYQVYAPEDITKKKTVNDAVKKIDSDFEGLRKHWDALCKINEFNFVCNDKYYGQPPDVEVELLKLKKRYNDVEFKSFSASQLEDCFFKLPEEKIYEIVGFPPSVDLMLLDYNSLNDVIEHIMNMPSNFETRFILNPPKFEEKIKFNDLSQNVSRLLTSGTYSLGYLEEYFVNNSKNLRAELQEKITSFYTKSIELIDENEEEFADKRFYYILQNCCPRNTKSVQDTALVILAYYFESCDIFEEPEGLIK